MVGALRSERSKSTKFYDRKVRFQAETSEASGAWTPVKRALPNGTPGAESHKRQKRKRDSAARRGGGSNTFDSSSNDDIDTFFNKHSIPYPKTPRKRNRKVIRIYLPTDMELDKESDSEPQDLASLPLEKNMGMPEFSDLSETALLAVLSPGRSSRTWSSDRYGFLPFETERVCRCDELQNENTELRCRYDVLYKKHQALVAAIRGMRAALSCNGVQLPDEMVCDVDDESSQASVGSVHLSSSSSEKPSTLTPSLTSSPSNSSMTSPAGTEAGTPSGSPAGPVRIIDEDYDEGWDNSVVRRQQIQLELEHNLGLAANMTMEQTMDKLTVALDTRVKIEDNNTSSTRSTASSDITFPPLPPLPLLPEFLF